MPVSDARKRANNKYNKKAYDMIAFRIRKDGDIVDAEMIRKAAEKSGESLNTYILNAIANRMKAEGWNITNENENED